MSRKFPRPLSAVATVVVLLGAGFAVSHGSFQRIEPEAEGVFHGDFASLDPPRFHRSPKFERLGSVALNLTFCLHNTSTSLATSFTCAHDSDDAGSGSHSNGDHFGNGPRQFIEYFERRFLRDPAAYTPLGITDGYSLMLHELKLRGITPQNIETLCALEGSLLEDTRDGLAPQLADSPPVLQMLGSSLCSYKKYLADPDSTRWWSLDYHEGHQHRETRAAGQLVFAGSNDTSDIQKLQHAAEGHGHSGPHGIDFNTEMNWVYAALSHQGKVAIINLNVVDWGKIATWERETGYRVLLFDEAAPFNPGTVLNYAQNLLTRAAGKEEELAKALDVAHRYCFQRAHDDLSALPAGTPWHWDRFERPAHLREDTWNALMFFRNHTERVDVANVPASADGWACFLAFTGIDARSWSDPQFMNPFCTWDTRHLARFDSEHSPGNWSRMNPLQRGAGDAWRCDWFIRYIQVTADIPVTVRRLVEVDATNDQPAYDPLHTVRDYVPETQLPQGQEYVEFRRNVTVGPHDLAYNPVNGLLYVTHYWVANDPDMRMLADWTIHLLDGNPASPAFHNPWKTLGGAGGLSKNAVPSGSNWINMSAYPVDVGGPIDALHPISVDVDVTTGRVFIVNRESNTVSMLMHNGERSFVDDPLEVQLSGNRRIAFHAKPHEDRLVPRDFSGYRDPNSMEPLTPAQVQGHLQVDRRFDPNRCDPIAELAGAHEIPRGNLSVALAACLSNELAAGGHTSLSPADLARPDVEALVRELARRESPREEMLFELRETLAAPTGFAAKAEDFLDRWIPRLTSPADRAFFEDEVARALAVSTSERPPVALEIFARAEARLLGRTAELIEDLVALVDPLMSLDAVKKGRTRMQELIQKWEGPAQDGSLLGLADASIEDGQIALLVESVEPIVGATFLTGSPEWLSYCVAYSVDDWLFHIVQGDDPHENHGKEAANGRHYWHCDDVLPIHYPDATPIQSDYVGLSNHHHVTIIREPIGPMLLDYWYEARPRIFQPFDVWFNSGDRTLYISNMGNHDNVPLVQGWISIIQPNEIGVPCHQEKAHDALLPILGFLAERLPKLSCHLPRPNSVFQANLLLQMDLMPHHINVNPYTFEVYGGHLLSDYVMAAQFEAERISWAVPKAHIFGHDVLPNVSKVPNPNPTGMGLNPSTSRLFMSHFSATQPTYVPLTGRVEDVTQYIGVADLRNYSLVNDMIFGGDHHIAVDMVRPPGRGAYDDPFYNRTQTLNVGGKPVTGSVLAVADTSTSIHVFWRCTYYAFDVNQTVTYVDSLVRRDREEIPLYFDAGRCYNIYDLNAQVAQWDTRNAARPGWKIVEDPNRLSTTYWEYGAEDLTFGIVNLHFDPDDVPANLRVVQPHGRDHDRPVQGAIQASEELVSAWIEVDTPEPVAIPQGNLVLLPDLLIDPTEPATLTFDTLFHVESTTQRRARDPDLMTISSRGTAEPPSRVREMANWSAATAQGTKWLTTKIPLKDAANTTSGSPSAVLTFAFDSGDAIDNRHLGWSVAKMRVEDRDGTTLRTFDLHGLPGYTDTGGVAHDFVVDPEDRSRIIPALSFHDNETGHYEVPRGQTSYRGSFTFQVDTNVAEPYLVIVHRQDVERPRPHPAGQPYDRAEIEATLDGGVTWHTVWMRDSRDPAIPQLTPQGAIDVTALTNHSAGRSIAFRLRFDAFDPVANAMPGWAVSNVVLRNAGRDVRLLPAPGTPGAAAPGEPRWFDDAGVYRFQNAEGTYEQLGGRGGAAGAVHRMEHGLFGEWGASTFLRAPGSGAFRFAGRDLAGHVSYTQHHDGDGTVLVEDTFRNIAFSEAYWERREIDPAGVGHVAYVFDPMMDGMGDLYPEDTPVQLVPAALEIGRRTESTGGPLVRETRRVLVEVPPRASNFFDAPKPLETETAALVDDSRGTGFERRRAFVLMPGEPDLETLPVELRKILHQEGTWLNASHVMLQREPEPVLLTLETLEAFLAGEPLMLGALLEEYLRTAKMALHTGQSWGLRQQPTDQYVIDGTPYLPRVATEVLAHPFTYRGASTPPLGADLAFDVVARHRFEDTILDVPPPLPRADTSVVRWLVHNVTLDKLNLTNDELHALLARSHLGSQVTNETLRDGSFAATHTLSDLGYEADELVNALLEGVADLLSVEVPVSEILNDLDRAQMSLPTFGEAFAVGVDLVKPDRTVVPLASRDGLGWDRPLQSLSPAQPGGDVLVTLRADPAAHVVRLGMEMQRHEKVRVHLDAARAAAALDGDGTYELRVTSSIRGGDAPAPGVFYELVLGDLRFSARPSVANAAPDAGFAWADAVNGPQVTLLPNAVVPAFANLGDQDGHIRRFVWTFPDSVANVSLRRGSSSTLLVEDLDASRADDAVTNAKAVAQGAAAQRLTLRPGVVAGTRELAYDAVWPQPVVPNLEFPGPGAYEVTLTAIDDDGAAASMTQTVVVGRASRAPEFVVDPVDAGAGGTALVWQRNPGSLILQTNGTLLNLSAYVDMANRTLESLRNRDNLTAHVDLSNEPRVTIQDIEGASNTTDGVVLAMLADPTRAPDTLLDWFLLRPGVAQVVQKIPEPAAGGVRAQVHLGEMPEPAALSIPMIADLLNGDWRLPQAPDPERLARGVDDPNILLDELRKLCDLDNLTPGPGRVDACRLASVDALRLLSEGILDVWAFKFALHPEKDGKADMNETLAQIVMFDTGVGIFLVIALDNADEVVRAAEESTASLTDGLTRVLEGIDPLVPVTPYVAAARAIQDEAQRYAALHPVTLTLQAKLTSLTTPDPLLTETMRALGLAAEDLEKRRASIAAITGLVDAADAATLATIAHAQNDINTAATGARIEVDSWAANAWTGISLAPTRAWIDDVHANASLDLDRASRAAANASGAARAALDNLTRALDTTVVWAEDWGKVLERHDPAEIQARLDATLSNVTALVALLTDETVNASRPWIDLINRTANPPLEHYTGPIDDVPLMLGYDSTTRRTTVRVGDFVVAEGVSRLPPSANVYTSMSLVSFGDHAAEVQAAWGGAGGARLYDGFNTPGAVDPARYDVRASPRLGTVTDVRVATMAAEDEETATQRGWMRKSAEGFDARAGRDAFANRHRFELDARGSPPGERSGELHDLVVSSATLAHPVDWSGFSADALARFDQAVGYQLVADAGDSLLREATVSRGRGPPSAPATFTGAATPGAPFVLDARAHRAPGAPERVQIALLEPPQAPADAVYHVFAGRRPDLRPDTAGLTQLGTVSRATQAPLGPAYGEPGWTAGVDHLVLETTSLPGYESDWRYLYAQAVSPTRGASALSAPHRVPPTLLQESFALHAEGPLEDGPDVIVLGQGSQIEADPFGTLRVSLDPCLGDRVEVTRWSNYPHDSAAAGFARSLRIQERGLDTLLGLLQQLGQDLDAVTVDLAPIDALLSDVDLGRCPTLRSLIEAVNNVSATTLLQALDIAHDASEQPFDPQTDIGTFDLSLAIATEGLGDLLGRSRTLDIDLEELLHGTPATASWRTENASGAYYARARFMIPGMHVGSLGVDTRIDRLLTAPQLGALHALVPGERFHLLQLGHTDATGAFRETLRVDFDPHLLAPVNVEQTAKVLDQFAALERDPLGMLAAGHLPLGYGIAAGDTSTSREIVGVAMMDTWHTVEVYSEAGSDVYFVTFDGRPAGTLRTSGREAPNTLRLGGSHVPTEVLFDDLRFMNALEPPVPTASVVRGQESFDFAAVRWHMPEDGGSPLRDFNILRRDLDTGAVEVVATAGGGFVRMLADPDSHEQPVGKRFAYSVQAVNSLDAGHNVGRPSDARGVALPGILRVSADASVAHDFFETNRTDNRTHEGARALLVGGLTNRTWRSVFQVNASQVVAADGTALPLDRLGEATFLAYVLDSSENRRGPLHIAPTLAEVLAVVGYNDHLIHAFEDATTLDSIHGAATWLEQTAPTTAHTVHMTYGDHGYYDLLEGLVNSTRIGLVISCPAPVAQATGQGWECHEATPEPIHHTGMCNDVSRDLELEEMPFNCHEGSVAAYVSPESAYDMASVNWKTQPAIDYWGKARQIDAQHTRNSHWRRYDVLPALRDDADRNGDVSIVLKKTYEQTPTARAWYAASEYGVWLDDALGAVARGRGAADSPFADGRGPDTFPWTTEVVASGDRAVKLDARGGLSSVRLGPSEAGPVPFDAPIKVRVFIPAGQTPREIGLRLQASVVNRVPTSGDPTGIRSCSGAYGADFSDVLVTWGDELVEVSKSGALVLNFSGEGRHDADLLTPIERFTGLHAGGVPTQRDRWITLTIDPGQLALEAAAEQRDTPLGLLGRVLAELQRIRGPATNTWLPEHLARAEVAYERLRPAAFMERIDGPTQDFRDITDYKPYNYFIPEWVFLWQNFDKFVEPWHCGLSVRSIEIFGVGGAFYVDRIGPDLAPRLRLDAGGWAS